MEPDLHAVGQRIKNIRMQLGMNQEEFAKATNSTIPAVSNWENARNLPNKARQKEIAILGNTTVNELLHGNIDEVDFDRNNVDSTLDVIFRYGTFIKEIADETSEVINSETTSQETKIETVESLLNMLSEILPVIINAPSIVKIQIDGKMIDDIFDDAIAALEEKKAILEEKKALKEENE